MEGKKSGKSSKKQPVVEQVLINTSSNQFVHDKKTRAKVMIHGIDNVTTIF